MLRFVGEVTLRGRAQCEQALRQLRETLGALGRITLRSGLHRSRVAKNSWISNHSRWSVRVWQSVENRHARNPSAQMTRPASDAADFPLDPALDFLRRLWQLNHALEKLS